MKFLFARCTAVLAVWLLAAVPLAAESASGLSWTAPSSWKPQEARPMRAATYVVPAAPGDREPGECVVYYFGPGQGGGVQANIDRWIQQFQAPSGGPADKLAQREQKNVNGIPATSLDLTGTYLFRASPMAPNATPKPGFRMLAVIAQGMDAPIFFKLTAPKKTTDAAEADFWRMIGSLKKQ